MGAPGRARGGLRHLGDFAGWNFGLAQGGWGGLLISTILMATMYTTMVFSLAELSSTIPTAGGGYGFARRAMGPWGGFMTGTAILIEYAIAPAAIATLRLLAPDLRPLAGRISAAAALGDREPEDAVGGARGPGVIGFILALTGDGAKLINIAVFGATSPTP